MDFTPKTDTEILEAGNWEAKAYDFEIVDAEETTSKSSGNEMFVLDVKIFDDEKTKIVKDYITSTQDWKLKSFAKATALLEEYDTGKMSADSIIGVTGRVEIVVQAGSGGYAAKNSVKSYIARAEELDDTEVPF